MEDIELQSTRKNMALFAVLCLDGGTYNKVKGMLKGDEDYAHVVPINCAFKTATWINGEPSNKPYLYHYEDGSVPDYTRPTLELLDRRPDIVFVVGVLNKSQADIKHNYLTEIAQQRDLKVISLLATDAKTSEERLSSIDCSSHPVFFLDKENQNENTSILELYQALFSIIDGQATATIVGLDFGDVKNAFSAQGTGKFDSIPFNDNALDFNVLDNHIKSTCSFNVLENEYRGVFVNFWWSKDKAQHFKLALFDHIASLTNSLPENCFVVFGVTLTPFLNKGAVINCFSTKLLPDHIWLLQNNQEATVTSSSNESSRENRGNFDDEIDCFDIPSFLRRSD